MPKDQDQKSKHICGLWGFCNCGKNTGTFWGIAFLAAGVYLIAKALGIITANMPFWGILFLLFGSYILYKKLVRK